ncbi:MAG: hypothetical protein IT370_08290 [Deltaproteobacteria bacterium]|nr:hypothetical protein [Deltaproteobacteria bacterium]
MLSHLGSRTCRGVGLALLLGALTLGVSACGGKKKAAGAGGGGGGAGKPEAPLTWKLTAIPSLGLSIDKPESWTLSPLGDGATQVDVGDGKIIVNLFKRPGRQDLGVLQTPPAGSAEEKVEWHKKLDAGAIWLVAQLPPGGGEAFGWTLTAKWSGLVAEDFEFECYALLAGSAARKKYEQTLERLCTSVAAAGGAAGDGGVDGGK